MKVLHVIPSLSKKLGGPTEVAINLVQALRQLGVDAEILTTNDDETGLLPVPLYQKVQYEQVPVWFFPRLARLKTFIPSISLSRWLYSHIREYDILDNHYLFSYVPTAAATIARIKGVPYTVRTMGQLAPWALEQSRLKKRIYTRLIEYDNLNHATAIHCTSVGEAQDVENFGIKVPKILLPLGVNPPSSITNASSKLHHCYNIPSNIPIILFLSRLHYKKRPDLLINSFAEVIQQGKSAHLLLAGSGDADYLTLLQQQVDSQGLIDHVTFCGFVSGEDKDLVLQGADIFALPSYSENFGIAVAEAMAVGLPLVITNTIQIAQEVQQFKAGLVIEGEQEFLTQALIQLLDNPSLCQSLGENGRKLAQQRYSWQEIARQLAEYYTSMQTS